MSEKKVVRNTSGADITVEYAGSSFRFDAQSETEVAADLADVAQYRHGNAGLNIVDHAAEAADREAKLAAEAPAVEATPAEPRTFVCPHGDYASNDEADYNVHLESAHGLGEQARKDAAARALPDELRVAPKATGVEIPSVPEGVVATVAPGAVVDIVPAAPPAESPSVAQPPAVVESPSAEPVKES